jgi:hypothetical protein
VQLSKHPRTVKTGLRRSNTIAEDLKIKENARKERINLLRSRHFESERSKMQEKPTINRASQRLVNNRGGVTNIHSRLYGLAPKNALRNTRSEPEIMMFGGALEANVTTVERDISPIQVDERLETNEEEQFRTLDTTTSPKFARRTYMQAYLRRKELK